jgi:hypothetical protein
MVKAMKEVFETLVCALASGGVTLAVASGMISIGVSPWFIFPTIGSLYYVGVKASKMALEWDKYDVIPEEEVGND